MSWPRPSWASLRPYLVSLLAVALAGWAWHENSEALRSRQAAESQLKQVQRQQAEAEQRRTAYRQAANALAAWRSDASLPAWSAQLLNAQQRLRIPALEAKAGPAGEEQGWQSQTIQLKLQLLHEGDLPQLIDELKRLAGPRWQFLRCQLMPAEEPAPLATRPLILADCQARYRQLAANATQALPPVSLSKVLATNANSPPLGRLFLTPPQRQQLDQQRRSNPYYQAGGSAPVAILRSDGQLIPRHNPPRIWINGQEQANPQPFSFPVGELLSPSTGARRSLLPADSLHRQRETAP